MQHNLYGYEQPINDTRTIVIGHFTAIIGFVIWPSFLLLIIFYNSYNRR